MKHLFYIAIFLVSYLGFAQNESLFEKANTLYNQGEYQQAIADYEQIIANGKHSAELYFNLGNAHYKLNHIAPSIYYYEKALLLKPNDSEIKNNIAFARNMTIDDIDEIPQVGFSKFLNNFSGKLTYDGWAIGASIFAIFCVILFLVYYFASVTQRKRLAFIGSMASLVLACLALSLAYHNYKRVETNRPAIVFAQETQVKDAPNLRSEVAFELHEGTKVQILDTVNNWKKIRLADGKIGWMVKDDLKPLNHF